MRYDEFCDTGLNLPWHFWKYASECPIARENWSATETPSTHRRTTMTHVSCLWCYNRMREQGRRVAEDEHDFQPNYTAPEGHHVNFSLLFGLPLTPDGDFDPLLFHMPLKDAWYDNAAECWILKSWARHEGILCQPSRNEEE